MPQVAAQFAVSLSFVEKLRRRQRTNGSVAALPNRGGPAPRLTEASCATLLTCVAAQPDVAHALRDTPFKINAVCLGYTKTDFTGHQGTSTVEEAEQRIVKYALLDLDSPTGQYVSEEYFLAPATCPW